MFQMASLLSDIVVVLVGVVLVVAIGLLFWFFSWLLFLQSVHLSVIHAAQDHVFHEIIPKVNHDKLALKLFQK